MNRQPTPRMTVSVIATVLNEAESIGPLLDSLAAQSRLPDEVVIVDGGSTDGTPDCIRRRTARGDLPLVLIERPGTGISAGRNLAIDAARGEVIASTDGGVCLDPDWLAELVAPFAHGARAVSGFFVADGRGPFETALGATTLPEQVDVDPNRFLPSSRSVAFRKDDWAAIGGYPEWLDYCEDLVFDIRLVARAGRPVFAPWAVVHFRPRRSLRAFFRQYYRYARGDGKAGLWYLRHAVRYATFLVAMPALALASWLLTPVLWLALLAGLAYMVGNPYRRLRRQWSSLSPVERARAIAWVPVIRVTGDVAKMVGYPVGVLWRLRHRPPDWRPAPTVGR
jgi:glycosyltransferase involved in cell wall biosynthesis